MSPVMVPPASALSSGVIAVPSVVVRWMVSPETLTMFQVASTAFTVTVSKSPEFIAVGIPPLPVRVLGALVSPGSNTCSWVKVRLMRRKNAMLPAGISLLASNCERMLPIPIIGPVVGEVQASGLFKVDDVCKLKPESGRVQLIQYAEPAGTMSTPLGPVAALVFQTLVVYSTESARKFSLNGLAVLEMAKLE